MHSSLYSSQTEGTIPQRQKGELVSETSLPSACPDRKEEKVLMGPCLKQNMYLHLGVPRKPLFPTVRLSQTREALRVTFDPRDESEVNELV